MINISSFLEEIKSKNPNEPEFIQAVEETFLSLKDFLNENPRYTDDKLLYRLTEPERTIIFRIPWTDDLGQVQVNRGYRVQFNSALGPYKGGLRLHPSVNLSILKFLGFEQTLKNALTGLPLGGGKGGSDFDPKGKSDSEIMRFCQSFMNELYKYIGPDTDVPAGDIGVGLKEIGYLFGQYKKLTGSFNGALTGKSPNWGGSFLRPEATGYGLVYFLESMLNKQGKTIKGKSVIISGSGNVAQFAADKTIELGGKVISMSDSNGTIFDEDGINPSKLQFIRELKNLQHGRIKEYSDKYKSAQYKSDANPWQIKADIALPCATQNEITLKDAKSLLKNKIEFIAEGANMPTTNAAIKLIQSRGITFAPAKASNAGGVAVSGLEMSQNALRMQWTKEEVDTKLKGIMSDIHDTCFETGKGDYLKGANIAGFTKVADSMIDQGIV